MKPRKPAAKKREVKMFWTIWDNQTERIFHQFDNKHQADLALKSLIERGFSKGVFEIITTQEVKAKKGRGK